MRARSLLAAVALLAIWPSAGAAQVSMVAEGDSVRLRVNGAVTIEAMTVAVAGDRLLLRTDGVANLWPVSFREMDRLHVLRLRTKREGFRQGFGTGLVAGLFIGAAVGLGLHTAGWVGDEDDPPAELMIHTTLVATGVGSLVGAFVGGFRGGSHPGVGWKRVQLPRRSTNSRPGGR